MKQVPRSLQIFCLGTAVALLYLCFGHYDGLIGDALDYHRLGLWLARSNLFSLDGVHASAARPPLYPFFISLIYRVAGIRPGAVRAAQCLLAGGTAALMYALARLDHSESKSIWIAGLCAVHPVLAAYASYFLSETLFVFLLAAGIFLYRLAQRTDPAAAADLPKAFPTAGSPADRSLRAIVLAAASGAALAFACLTRAALFYFPPAWFLFEWIRTKRVSIVPAVGMCVFYLCLAPWAWRNYSSFGVVLPVSVGGGYALWAGSQPGQYPKTSDYSAFIAPYEWHSPAGDKLGTAKALRLYRANLPRILLDIPRRSLHFWLTSHSAVFGYSESFGDCWRKHTMGAVAVKLLGFVFQGALLFFAALGMARGRRHAETYLPLALIAYASILIVLTDYWPNRYHVPLIPFLIYVGAHGF